MVDSFEVFDDGRSGGACFRGGQAKRPARRIYRVAAACDSVSLDLDVPGKSVGRKDFKSCVLHVLVCITFFANVLDFPRFAEDLCVLAFFDHFTFNHCCLVSDLHVDCEVVWDRADLAMLLKASRLSATGVSGWYC